MDLSDPSTTLAIGLRAATLVLFAAILVGLCAWLFAPLRHGHGNGAIRARRDGGGRATAATPPPDGERPPPP